ncbi:MAG: tetratricopeptide repeat protein [Deltaproteobacteria bacterium]|nr:MAG: tetratricopeptide repeat protein [Deltaproteobacteria bacterium]
MILLLAALLAQGRPPPLSPQPPPPQQMPAEGPAGWREQFDELWKKRDQPGMEKKLNEILHQQLAADPGSFEANWRLASLFNWQADGAKGGDFKAALGKAAWQAGDKAILAKPEDVRGHYQGGTGIGLYSEGVGILTALAQGLEGKFRDRLLAALRIDKDYLDGAPQVVWGRYFYKLPWPKRDVAESIKVLSEALRAHPNNLRAKIYLADSLAEDGKAAEAKQLIEEVLQAKAGDNPPEEKRLKEVAQQWKDQH